MTDWLGSLPSYGITLKSRSTDRLLRFKAALEQCGGGLDHTLTMFEATPSPFGGKYGCWESHMTTLLMAEQAHPTRPSLHFEDDACATKKGWHNHNIRDNILAQVKALVEGDADPSWRIIGLGGCPLSYSMGTASLRGVRSTSSPHVLQTGFAETHAYIISPVFRRHILVNTNYEGHVDYMYAREAGSHSYLVTPELFAQDPTLGSDNYSWMRYATTLRAPYKSIHTTLAVVVARHSSRPWRWWARLLLGLATILWALALWFFHSTAMLPFTTMDVLLAVCTTVLFVLWMFDLVNSRILDPYMHNQAEDHLRRNKAGTVARQCLPSGH